MKTLISILTVFMLFPNPSLQEGASAFNDFSIHFKGKGAEGTFSDLEGVVRFDPDNLENSRIDVTVKVNTISTGSDTKDKHARGDSWFDAALYPSIGFASQSFESKGNGQYVVNGVMRMHGIEKNVSIAFIHQRLESSSILDGSFTIDRQDFGIKGPFMAFTVGDEFEVTLHVDVVEK